MSERLSPGPGYYNFRCRRVPIAEIYDPPSRNFNNVCLDEIGESSTEVTWVYGMVNVEGFAALPASQNVEDWLCPEENGYDA